MTTIDKTRWTMSDKCVEPFENYRVPAIRGRYAGMTLGEIARSARGLWFLLELSLQEWLPREAQGKLKMMLGHPKYAERIQLIDYAIRPFDA